MGVRLMQETGQLLNLTWLDPMRVLVDNEYAVGVLGSLCN